MNQDLDELGRQLDEIQGKKDAQKRKEEQAFRDADNMGRGIRAGAELITPMIAGGFIGWALDNWLDTKPIFLIIMLLLGVTTGFINVWRMTQNIGSSIGYSELHRRGKNANTAPEKNDPKSRPE